MRENHYGFNYHHRKAIEFAQSLQPGEAKVYPRRMPKAMTRALQKQIEADGFTKDRGYYVIYVVSELDVEKTAMCVFPPEYRGIHRYVGSMIAELVICYRPDPARHHVAEPPPLTDVRLSG